jgi:hypothetical protein
MFTENYASPLSLHYKFTSDKILLRLLYITHSFLPKSHYKNTFLHTKREAKKILQ